MYSYLLKIPNKKSGKSTADDVKAPGNNALTTNFILTQFMFDLLHHIQKFCHVLSHRSVEKHPDQRLVTKERNNSIGKETLCVLD